VLLYPVNPRSDGDRPHYKFVVTRLAGRKDRLKAVTTNRIPDSSDDELRAEALPNTSFNYSVKLV